MILANGSLMDPRLPPFNIEAEKYNMLARAALFQNPVFNEPTLTSVQALVHSTSSALLTAQQLNVGTLQFLMSIYLFFSERNGSNGGQRWALIGQSDSTGDGGFWRSANLSNAGMTIKLAQSVRHLFNAPSTRLTLLYSQIGLHRDTGHLDV